MANVKIYTKVCCSKCGAIVSFPDNLPLDFFCLHKKKYYFTLPDLSPQTKEFLRKLLQKLTHEVRIVYE